MQILLRKELCIDKAICYRPQVARDDISGQNVKATEGYVVVNFEVASLSSS